MQIEICTAADSESESGLHQDTALPLAGCDDRVMAVKEDVRALTPEDFSYLSPVPGQMSNGSSKASSNACVWLRKLIFP